MTALLNVEALGKRFGGLRALRSVDLEIGAGELVGLIGPNGSGKTTLLNIVGGYDVPTSGRGAARRPARGRRRAEPPRAARGRAVVPGGQALPPPLGARKRAGARP